MHLLPLYSSSDYVYSRRSNTERSNKKENSRQETGIGIAKELGQLKDFPNVVLPFQEEPHTHYTRQARLGYYCII